MELPSATPDFACTVEPAKIDFCTPSTEWPRMPRPPRSPFLGRCSGGEGAEKTVPATSAATTVATQATDVATYACAHRSAGPIATRTPPTASAPCTMTAAPDPHPPPLHPRRRRARRLSLDAVLIATERGREGARERRRRSAEDKGWINFQRSPPTIPPTHARPFAWACSAWVDGGRADAERRAHLLFSVECRRRLVPPIPKEYLGNCLWRWRWRAGSGLHDRALDDGVLASTGGWFHKILSLVLERLMSVGGLLQYGVYEIDFGLGRPIKVELVSIDKTPGTVSLAEGRDKLAGIEIGVVLPEADMACFSSCFADRLEQLL
ncbi:hypothetical protein SETIT_5G168700v2 [Setaria italica]|uniref:Uncharacterized protein n=1 Tax=Setaria italica TaxID=4555 RepID=K3XRP4_SETIT|nr:hypothetical protein SETIT_5G168700v2 [Setaria italica]